MVPPTVQVFRVSATESPENLLTTQNPESLGSESPIPPAQMASPSRIGEAPSSKAMGPRTVDAVISASVVFPRETRRICENRNASKRIGIDQPVIVFTR